MGALIVIGIAACHRPLPAGFGDTCGTTAAPDSAATPDSASLARDDCPSDTTCVEFVDAFEQTYWYCSVACASDDDCRFNGCDYLCMGNGFCGVLPCY